MRAVLLFALLVACAAPGDEGTPPPGGGGSEECGPCTTPPAASCVNSCSLRSYETNGTCQDGECVYQERITTCDHGCGGFSCNAAPSPLCGAVLCGERNSCGGVCDQASGCCEMFTYDRTTGPTASGTMVCCDGTDVRLAAADCGEGDNHYITMSDPNCAVAFEGPDNYGGPCAVVTCEGTTCVADPGVD